MKVIDNILYADAGKNLRRKSDKRFVGNKYGLGYIYYLNGIKLLIPHLETESDFEELTLDAYMVENRERYVTLVEQYIREKYTTSDELATQRQRDTKPDAFKLYFNFCEECKERAKNLIKNEYQCAI